MRKVIIALISIALAWVAMPANVQGQTSSPEIDKIKGWIISNPTGEKLYYPYAFYTNREMQSFEFQWPVNFVRGW